MAGNLKVIIAEDDDGHAALVRKNLKRSGLSDDFLRCKDGLAVMDFFFEEDGTVKEDVRGSYMLLLDIRMPGMDGIEVLRRIKNAPRLQMLPVIMLTTTDDPHDIEVCHTLGCNCYVTKPVDYMKFVEKIQSLGQYLKIAEVPAIA